MSDSSNKEKKQNTAVKIAEPKSQEEGNNDVASVQPAASLPSSAQIDTSAIFSNDRTEEEKKAGREAAEKWYSNLDESKKSQVDKGIESILYHGCMLAARQAFDTAVKQKGNNKRESSSRGKRKKGKNKRWNKEREPNPSPAVATGGNQYHMDYYGRGGSGYHQHPYGYPPPPPPPPGYYDDPYFANSGGAARYDDRYGDRRREYDYGRSRRDRRSEDDYRSRRHRRSSSSSTRGRSQYDDDDNYYSDDRHRGSRNRRR